MTFSKIFLASFIALVSLSSCSKKDIIANKELSADEAVEIISVALQSNTAGVTYSMEKYSEELTTDITINEICDSLYARTHQFDHNGTLVQSAYTINSSYEMTCIAGNIPQSVAVSYDTEGTFNSQRIGSDDSSVLTAQVNGLSPSETLLTLSGNYSRTGTQDLSLVNSRSVSSTVELDLTAVEIDKEINRITYGEASVTLTGSTESVNFSFTGSIVFNGNEQATLILNNSTYIIDLN